MVVRNERTGMLFVLVTPIIEGLFPIFAVMASDSFPPIFFVAFAVLIAFFGFGAYFILSGSYRVHIPFKVFLYSAIVASIVLSGFVLIMIGSKSTTGINTALLLKTEMVFAFLLSAFLLKEDLHIVQMIGALLVLLGAVAVLFNGSISLNIGDVIILSAGFLFPVANIFAKKALQMASSTTVLFLRYSFGVCIFIPLSFLLEDPISVIASMDANNYLLLFSYGILVLTISKICWYIGLRILPIGIVTYVASSASAFSLVFAYFLLKEVPSSYQFIGFILSLVGVYLIVRKPPVPCPPADLV